MSSAHQLQAYEGVKVCKKCGAALHRNGRWYYAGCYSMVEPNCKIGNRDWLERATQPNIDVNSHGL